MRDRRDRRPEPRGKPRSAAQKGSAPSAEQTAKAAAAAPAEVSTKGRMIKVRCPSPNARQLQRPAELKVGEAYANPTKDGGYRCTVCGATSGHQPVKE